MLLKIREAAEMFGISEKAMRRRVERGSIPAVKLSPRTIRIDSEVLDQRCRTAYIPTIKNGTSFN